MQYKLKKLIWIKQNVIDSSKILSFRRPKWQQLKKSFLFTYYKIFFFKSYKIGNIISWLFPFKEISNVFLKKRFYFKTNFKQSLILKSSFQIFYNILSLKKWQKHLKFQFKSNRSNWLSCFELKSIIILYRIGWCLSIANSLIYIKNNFFFKNNKIILCGYQVLIGGDLLNVNYKYFKIILLSIKNKSSFFFIPFYNTFLNSRKPFIYTKIIKNSKIKKSYIKFRLKFLKILFFNRLTKMFYTLEGTQINSTVFQDYFKLLGQFFNNCEIKLDLFNCVLVFNKLCINKFQTTISLIKFVKQYLFLSLIKQQLFKLLYFYLFKFSYFIDKYSFLIPHYTSINYNNLELLILLNQDQIKYNKSKYMFWNRFVFL